MQATVHSAVFECSFMVVRLSAAKPSGTAVTGHHVLRSGYALTYSFLQANQAHNQLELVHLTYLWLLCDILSKHAVPVDHFRCTGHATCMHIASKLPNRQMLVTSLGQSSFACAEKCTFPNELVCNWTDVRSRHTALHVTPACVVQTQMHATTGGCRKSDHYLKEECSPCPDQE